jgi:SAM-dependent methyltransferase
MIAGPTDTGATLTRHHMYAALRGVVPEARTLLSVSRSGPLVAALDLGGATVTAVDYPECDLRDLPFDDGLFDLVVADQVLEHVEGYPERAVAEAFRVVRPGGHVVLTTCFMNPVHEAPDDFWRFSPAALEILCRQGGGEVVTSGGWGNRMATFLLEMGFRTVPVPRWRRHPLRRLADRNDPRWPIVTWVVGRKVNDPPVVQVGESTIAPMR